ncbi:MAG: DUF4231 domain-containing protein [Cyanobacteria bacterium P01_G01_bin.39]
MIDSSLEKSPDQISEPQVPKNYSEQFKQEMIDLIEQIELSDLQRQFIKSRWMSQLLWLESRAQQNRNRYYFLRLVTIIGGVIVPALVSLNINSGNIKEIMGWFAFGLSQAVAISAAVEEFFHYGERYRHYRNTAELMKIEAWQFFQLSGPYHNVPSHSEVYADFAQRVEDILRRDVEGYISGVAKEKTEKPK